MTLYEDQTPTGLTLALSLGIERLANYRCELLELDLNNVESIKVAEAAIDLTIAADKRYSNDATRKAAARIEYLTIPGRMEYDLRRTTMLQNICRQEAVVSALRVQFASAELAFMAQHGITAGVPSYAA